MRRSPTGTSWWSRAPTSSTSAGSRPRPGAERPPVAEELRRVLPVVRALAPTTCVSIDTMRAEVAAAALEAGARLVNDVSGGQADPEMLGVVARAGVPYVCMHWRGHAQGMQSRATYADVVGEVASELADQVAQAKRAGIAPDRLILDPGFGFAKTGEHNWELLQRLDELDRLGRPAAARAVPQGVPRYPAGRRDRPAPARRGSATTPLPR